VRYSDVLRESRMAPLYHHMEDDKAIDVFEFDTMPARWDHTIPGIGQVAGNSFSRNKRFNMGRPVRITIDQQRLSNHHRIIPLDGELVFRLAHDQWPARDRGPRNSERGDHLAEEFVIGDIRSLHRYVLLVELRRATAMTDAESWDLYTSARKFTKNWRIPLRVDPEYLRRQKERLARWREDEDEAEQV